MRSTPHLTPINGSGSDFCAEGFPWARPRPDLMPPPYADLRKNAPFYPCTFNSGEKVWLATSYEAVVAVLSSRVLSSEHSHPDFPGVFALPQRRDSLGRPPKLSLSALDGAEHRFHRQRVAGEFRLSAIARETDWIKRMATNQLDRFIRAGSPNDFVKGFARPFVARIIAMVLGLTVEEAAYCAGLSDVILGAGHNPQLVPLASSRLRALVATAIEDRRRRPRHDLLSRIVQRYEADEVFDQDRVLALAASLITAGLETTAHTISIGILMLVRAPDQLEELSADASLMANAVEEILRLSSVADIVTARVAPHPCCVFGVELPAGAGIVASTAAANRDENFFTDPDEMRLDHGARRAHLAFGYGPHKCLGRHLARTMLSAAMEAFIDISGDFRLSEDPGWTASEGVMAGVSELMVEWSSLKS